MFETLEAYVTDYNFKHKDDGGHIVVKMYCAAHGNDSQELSSDEDTVAPKTKKLKIQTFKEEEPLAVAICTPLMARVHQRIPQAGEIMFVDSSSSLDRYNFSVFILSTSHCGGGLPLGVMIVSNEATSTLQGCLSQLQSIFPKEAFHNQPTAGPKVIMTDDSESQREALATAWPKATQLLCVFHVLQAFWTWLHEGKNKVRKEHRKVLMSKVKELVYAESEQVFNSKYQALTSDHTAIK